MSHKSVKKLIRTLDINDLKQAMESGIEQVKRDGIMTLTVLRRDVDAHAGRTMVDPDHIVQAGVDAMREFFRTVIIPQVEAQGIDVRYVPTRGRASVGDDGWYILTLDLPITWRDGTPAVFAFFLPPETWRYVS